MIPLLIFVMRLFLPVLIIFMLVKVLAWKTRGRAKNAFNAIAGGLLWLLVPLVAFKILVSYVIHHNG